MSVDPNVDIPVSVPKADEDSESVHEAEGPEVSRNEYLHEGGWQNVDNPLHELEFVQNEIHSFHLDQEHLEHRQCTMCKEAWPTRQNLASEVYICYQCKRDKKSPKKFSAENDMDPGTVPEQLRGLTQTCLVLIVRRHGAEDTHRDFTVRRHKVLEAVLWLKTNNPFFKDIEIDRDVIQSLPENGIPDELRYVIDENELSVHVENEGPPQDPVMSANASVEELVLGSGSTSFIPMRQRQRKEGAAIQDAVNEVDPLDWPSTEGNLVNEFKTDGLATMAFPTLFPYGKGDPKNRARQHGITLTEAFKHLMKFAERLADGKFEWRFASHPRFPYWALNMKQRHQRLSQANVYLRQHPADANMTMEKLKQMVNSMSANQMMNRLQRYVSKVQGTNQYWYQRLQELLALIEQKGCPTFFFTFSAADMHWPDLQRLLQNDEGASRSERAQAVIDNPHLTDWFFMQRLQEFVRHWLNGILDAEWHWYRFEYQARGSIHCHGCAKLKKDSDIRKLRTRACVAFLESETTKYEMSPDDFEFLCGDLIRQGEDAEKLLIQYVDWLVTTFNEELPDENWSVPDPHPSAVRATTVDNRDNDYHRLVNTVERHTRCSPAYCLKQKRVDLLAECRFGFPKPLQEETELSRELVVSKNTKSVESELHTKRNDQRLNSHNRVMLENWQANVDLQVIVDEKACARYMAKYAAKGEPRSKSASLQNDDQVSSAFKKAMIQVAGDRDMAAQETAHMLLSLPLVGCTFSFVTISLDNSRKVNIDAENEGDELLKKSQLQEYAECTKLKSRYTGLSQLNLMQYGSQYTKVRGYSDERDRVHDAQCGQTFENDPSDNQDDDDESEVDPDEEEEVDDWMLLCRINQDYGEAGNQMPDNEAVDWFETVRAVPRDLLRESPGWIYSQRKEAEEHGQQFREDDQQCVIDPDTLNEKQRLAYNIIQSQNGDNAEPVYMIVCGTAGTGKTYLISATKQVLATQCVVTATTGIAAFSINGQTLHSAAQLPIREYRDLQGDSLQRLQVRLEGKRFLIIDEMSMIGHKMLSWLDNRLRAGTGKQDILFGGMSVILMGDFGQLPPVGDKPMYVSGNGTVVSDHGHSLYLMFESVIILDQVMRQAGEDPEAIAFRALLMRMRNGEVTGEDWKLLLEHSTTNVPMDQFTDAIRLYFDKKSVAEYNYLYKSTPSGVDMHF
ncbi:ATP-dependent DNA helicase PIF1 [Paramuricea clavata]|uniref:ATP-dependent DNA helicase n=1 Tax=Paramuricea clavata TaxID=317549 RepID=A0A6S7JTH8_PARCT|nr:ATP-dependent DNA helicase PIF1 [Paramuricea clavata]